MSYNNLLYLLVVIFLVTSGPDSNPYSAGALTFVSFWLGKLGCFYLVCKFLFSPSRVRNPASYIKAEQVGSVLAIGMVGVDVYYFHGLYYVMMVPGFRVMPILAHILFVMLFFFYLAIVWFRGCVSQNRAFGRRSQPKIFILENLQANLPIGLPWVFVSVCIDVLRLVPVLWLHEFMVEGSGELVVFGVFFVFLALIFPPLLMKIWGCRSVGEGGVRDELEAMCRRLQLKYRDIVMWPLFGGQVLTAGVVGFVKQFRYILITHGLLASLTPDEVESVLAHETGHVKYYHMQLYLFVLFGFSMIIAPVLCGVNYLLLQSDWTFLLIDYLQVSVVKFVELTETIVLFVAMILFVRFVFGFFMRNFERQADLHAFSATGGSGPIASALEKVAWLSGNIRDLPSWHHFGVGQRVDFLLACERDPSLVQKHHKRILKLLLAYGLLIGVSIASYMAIPADYLETAVAVRIEETLLAEAAENPANPNVHWMVGDFYYHQARYFKAVQAYQRSLLFREANPEVHNNLAWIFVTSEDGRLLDPKEGLVHAARAVELLPAPHILDTLAHALWVNGRREEALLVEKQALESAKKTGDSALYQQQVEAWQREL